MEHSPGFYHVRRIPKRSHSSRTPEVAERIPPTAEKVRVVAALLVSFFLILGVLIWRSGLLPPRVVTEECPFCGLYVSDGLALVNTQTGAAQLIEIWLWDDEGGPTEPGDWETQLRNGDHCTFSFMAIGGYQQTHMGGTLLTFTPEIVNTTAYFCQEHSALAVAPYVLVDRSQKDHYISYPIQPGEDLQFRHYAVSVSQDGADYVASIESSLFEQEVALWNAEREKGQTDQ